MIDDAAMRPAGTKTLDALNALVAGGQTGFGAFIAVHLTAQAWTQGDIGEALAVGTVAAMISQIPAGALVDWMRSKRLAIAAGAAAIAVSALLFAVTSARLPVLLAEVLHGFASCMIGPAIAAISLQFAGNARLGERLGRNARFASLGSAAAALALGGIGTWVSGDAVFWATAAMMAAGLAVAVVSRDGYAALPIQSERSARMPLRGLLDRRLLAFAVCVAGFHLANAAMLPLVAGAITRAAGSNANLVIAACIVAPQAIVALASPLIGRKAESWGRRPVLLLGFLALPLRGVLLACGVAPGWVIAVQALDGISAAALGVLMPLVAADITRRSGGYSAALGVLGFAAGGGATLSTWLAGLVADHYGAAAALLSLAGAGAAAAAGLLALPETRPPPARSYGTIMPEEAPS
jgi:MFS family permease